MYLLKYFFNIFGKKMDDTALKISLHEYHIRQFNTDEWPLYKQLRLEALKLEPSMFRVTIPPETELSDAGWAERINETRAVFGLYHNNTLIGVTSILLLNDEEAYLGQSYIQKEYRGKGLSSLFYKIRLSWASLKQLKRLSISHRKSNAASKAANQRFGFRYTHTTPCTWQDGQSEDVLYYVLDLK